MAADPLIPINTPFRYNLGVNYESWENGRTGRSIAADLNQITQYFGLIKTFHDVATGTANPSNPQIDPTQQQVISYVAKTKNVDLVMGTLNSALFQGGFGSAWKPGLMTSSAYTDKWVQMIIKSFGSKQAVQGHLKMVLLGNEIDANGPPPNDPSFNSYKTWIKQSFDNLSASLKKAGLGSIPVSTTIANYGVTNAISVEIPTYIEQHWSRAWNGGRPIVLFNQYTPGFSSTDFNHDITYFDSVYQAFKGKLEPFIGETGYSSYYGQANQNTVYKQISAWLTGQYQFKNGHKTVPLFAFDAFDQPNPPGSEPREKQFGIFGQNGSYRPTGLKRGLNLPGWSKTPISMSGDDRMHLFEGTFAPGITVDGGAGTDALVLAEPHAVDFSQGRIVDVESLRGSEDNDTVRMTASQFLAFDRIDLRDGTDALKVAVKGSFGPGSDSPDLEGIETLNLVGPGQISLNLVRPDHWTELSVAVPHATVDESLGYAGALWVGADTELTIKTGARLNLVGGVHFFHNTIDGAGLLHSGGGTTANGATLGGTAQWFNSGFLTVIGNDLTIGGDAGKAARFVNQTSGVVGLAGDVDIDVGTGASILVNRGMLAKTAGDLSTIAIAMRNRGTIDVASGTLVLEQGVIGNDGVLKIGSGNALQIDGAVSGQTVDFNGGNDRLILTDAESFAARLQDFGAGDHLDLREFDPTTTTVAFRENDAGTACVLTVTDGALQARIVLLGQYEASSFHAASDGLGGTIITYEPPALVLAAQGAAQG